MLNASRSFFFFFFCRGRFNSKLLRKSVDESDSGSDVGYRVHSYLRVINERSTRTRRRYRRVHENIARLPATEAEKRGKSGFIRLVAHRVGHACCWSPLQDGLSTADYFLIHVFVKSRFSFSLPLSVSFFLSHSVFLSMTICLSFDSGCKIAFRVYFVRQLLYT